MHLSATATATLALAGCAVAVLASALAVVALVRLRRVRRDFRVLWGDRPADVAAVAAGQARELQRVSGEVEAVRGQLAAVRHDMAQGLRNVAVVRYDAFGDMGGRLSFSCAVVDDYGDGLVLSSIHARGESRTYAKGIVSGGSDATLTPEEQQALTAARDGRHGQDGRNQR